MNNKEKYKEEKIYLDDFKIVPGSAFCRKCNHKELVLNELSIPTFDDSELKEYSIECIHRNACEYVLNSIYPKIIDKELLDG